MCSTIDFYRLTTTNTCWVLAFRVAETSKKINLVARGWCDCGWCECIKVKDRGKIESDVIVVSCDVIVSKRKISGKTKVMDGKLVAINIYKFPRHWSDRWEISAKANAIILFVGDRSRKKTEDYCVSFSQSLKRFFSQISKLFDSW